MDILPFHSSHNMYDLCLFYIKNVKEGMSRQLLKSTYKYFFFFVEVCTYKYLKLNRLRKSFNHKWHSFK